MATFAELNENNIVINVLKVEDSEILINGVESEIKGVEFLQKLFGHNRWKKCSVNTRGGKHYDAYTNVLSDTQEKAFRGNYPAINDIYDPINDGFHETQKFASWTLNTTTFLWEPPITYPEDGKFYRWNEAVYQADIYKCLQCAYKT